MKYLCLASVLVAFMVSTQVGMAQDRPPFPNKFEKQLRLSGLTVVSANISNAFTLGTIRWQDKADRFAALIAGSGVVPDIISMTESSGWTWCGGDTTADYEMIERILSNLRKETGVTYRIAYMVGAGGVVGGHAGLCHYYTGDTVLYNPNRVTNLTPADVATRPQVQHDARIYWTQVRRSLPLCNRGPRLEPLETLIDGPPQTDKCGRLTPSGPAWLLVVLESLSLGDAPVASLARFSLVDVPGSSFDVFTVHPTANDEEAQKFRINEFINAMTRPPFRTTNPYYPTIVLGDYNSLVNDPGWPSGTSKVFFAPEDVIAVSLGNNTGPLPSVRSLRMNLGLTLPNLKPCRPLELYPDKSFSDHCGLLVRFSE